MGGDGHSVAKTGMAAKEMVMVMARVRKVSLYCKTIVQDRESLCHGDGDGARPRTIAGLTSTTTVETMWPSNAFVGNWNR